MAKQQNRIDHEGKNKRQFEINRKKIYASQQICALCGKPVDFSLKFPHPMAPTIDHIIPIKKGGHPTDMDNLQLAHWSCNRYKSDKILNERFKRDMVEDVVSNRNLPQSTDWSGYRH